MRLRNAIFGLAAWEALQWYLRVRARTRLYVLAQARARALARPLVVVGDPHPNSPAATPGGGLTPGPGCGDICVDLTGCPRCPKGIAVDIGERIPLADDSSVVFVSCVLEYVTDWNAALAELLRVAGSPRNLFVVHVTRWSLAGWLYPGALRRFSVHDLPAGTTFGELQ